MPGRRPRHPTHNPSRRRSAESSISQALELAKQALNTAPGDVQILTLEALAWKGLGQDQNALTAFQHALRIAPNYLAALEGAAQIEYAAGSDAAIPLLDRLLKLRPDEPTAHAMRAVMAWKQRDCPTAVAHFERSRSVMASQPDALREYGICLVRLNQPEAAAAVFQQIVSTNPEDRPARYSLSSVEMMAQRYKDALDTLRPLLAASTDAEALALASTAYEALGDTPQAVAALRQAIVIAPRNVAYYLDFANLSFAHKSYDAGIQMVNAGLKLSPESPQLHLARGDPVGSNRTDRSSRRRFRRGGAARSAATRNSRCSGLAIPAAEQYGRSDPGGARRNEEPPQRRFPVLPAGRGAELAGPASWHAGIPASAGRRIEGRSASA